MRERTRVLLGCAIGLVAIALLFLWPGASPGWLLAFSLSSMCVRSGGDSQAEESLEDVSGRALAAAFAVAAILFALFLAPKGFWSFLGSLGGMLPVPAAGNQSALAQPAPWWARIGLAAFWMVIMWRGYARMKRQESMSSG